MSDSRPVWHFDRRVGIDVIISSLILLGGGLAYVLAQSDRQTKTETKVEALEQADKRIEGEMRGQEDKLLKRLDRMDEKLDRLVERGHR